MFVTDHTQGTHCEFCVPGSFGNATIADGCKPCQCNGHADPGQHLCDMATGKCFCTDNTMGYNCDKCMPGLKGNAKYVLCNDNYLKQLDQCNHISDFFHINMESKFT